MAIAATSAVSSSGLDVNGIVSQLMTLEQQPIINLNTQEASYQAKLSAFGTISGGLSAFQSAVNGLSSASQFQSVKATPSDATIFSASAASTAVPGSYTLDVTSLAQAQKLVAAGQVSSTAAIGTGAATTITFDFGTISGGTYTAYNSATNTGGTYAGSTFTSNGNGSKSITINGTNNSLQNIRDAINTANIGVTAAIVNDGSGTPYRLTLASNNMGVSNSLNISVSGDAAISSLLSNNPGAVASVAGSNTLAAGTQTAVAAPGATAGTLAAGALIANTSAGAVSIGAVTLGTNAVTNGTAIAAAINTALAAATGGAAVNGTAAANAITGVVTITAGTSAITLSMGGSAADSVTAAANQAALSAQTGFSAAQLGTQAIGTQNLAQSITAQNAVFNVNGIQVSKTSNTVSDVIQGVTLNLQKLTTTTSTLTVARDTAATTNAINGFVKAYNDLAKMFKDATSYNATTKQAAIFQGDSTIRTLQSELRNMLGASVNGTSGALTTLTQLGIAFQKDGSLAVDSAKLSTAMTNFPNDIASLFASVGNGTDSLVSYKTATASTKPGNYAVNISQLATMGLTTGDLSVPASNNTIASGTAINVTLDGITASVALNAGTYTNTQLATMIQSAVNGTAAFSTAGSSAAASINGNGFLNISSNRYGSTSNVSMNSGTGTAVSAFMGTVTTGLSGVDVVGTIDGVTAGGSGQTLTSSSGAAQGLSIAINGGALGARGMLNYSQGYATTLSNWSTTILASGGVLSSRTDGINRSIKDIGNRRTAVQTRLVSIEANYRRQYSALDVMLSNMNQTSIYLTQQLANLPKPY